MPKISIVIPAYNEEKYLSQTIHSIKKQNFSDYEIIVVANGCSDCTEELVRKETDSRLKLLSMSTANVSRARNHGADKSTGEVLLFLDADTTLAEDALQEINNKFSEKYSVATTCVRPDDPNMKFRLALGVKNILRKLQIYVGTGGSLICRRDDFNKAGGYDHTRTIMEHKHLIKKLRVFGKYTSLNTYTTTSMRRLKSWGLSKVIYFWLKEAVKEKIGKLNGKDYNQTRESNMKP